MQRFEWPLNCTQSLFSKWNKLQNCIALQFKVYTVNLGEKVQFSWLLLTFIGQNEKIPFFGYKSNLVLNTSLDINECDNKNGGCKHNCHNNIGSYRCSCRKGYALSKDKHDCKG